MLDVKAPLKPATTATAALRRRQRKGAAGYLLAAPLGLFLILAVLIPVASGVVTAFQSFNLNNPGHPFTGFSNFKAVLADPGFYSAISFTLVFTFGSLIFEMALGIALALLFDRAFPGKRVFLTLAMFPIMIAPSFMAILWRLSLNSDAGLFAAMVKKLGLSDNLLGSSTAIPTLIMVDSLHWAPFVMLMVYAGLQTVPQDLYEAANLDGAGYWKTRFLVVAPYVMPTLAITLFLRLIDGLKTFDTIYILTGGGPGTETTNINVYVYKLAFTGGDFGAAAATSLMFLIVLLVLVPLVTRYLVPGQPRSKA